MTEHYDREEKKLEERIYNRVHAVSDNSKVHLNVYYRNSKLKNLLVKSSPPGSLKPMTTVCIAILVMRDNVTCHILDTPNVN